MRVTLLTAFPPSPIDDAVQSAFAGDDMRLHRLVDAAVAPCTGCFECWVKSPGRCKANDAANGVMADLIAGAMQVWVAPVRFGTWHPTAKKALDKCIGLLSPFFAEIDGETHHAPRYDQYPTVLAVGVFDDDAPDEDVARFRTLVTREALNFLSPSREVVVVRRSTPVEEVAARVAEARASLRERREGDTPATALPVLRPEPPVGPGVVGPGRPRRALLLVGSGKPAGESASEHLGRGLLDRLEARGWATRTLYAAKVIRFEGDPRPELLEAASEADLLVVATPVYVDTTPALVTAALHHLVDARPRLAVMGLVQCGFPEEEHTWLVPPVLEAACRDAGWTWLGAVTLGGAALSAQHQATPEHDAGWDAIADALDRGEGVPAEAAAACATPVISPRVYRWAGHAGWVGQAWRHGAVWNLGARPFAPDA
jgi:multimeric flavodoxin WrbA